MYKYGLIRKLRLILKSVSSQTGQRIITMHLLPSISRSKGNQAKKFIYLIECNMKTTFLQTLGENEAEKLVLDLFFLFKTFYIT